MCSTKREAELCYHFATLASRAPAPFGAQIHWRRPH